MLGRWTLLLGALAQGYAHRLRAYSERRADWQDSQMLNVQLWTWNSGKAHLQQEAKRLSLTEADFIVSCQTEASKHIGKWMPAEWMQVARGEHWGAAGGGINAQIASVFARRPLDGKLIGNESKLISVTPWSSDVGSEESIKFEGFDGTTHEVFKIQTQVMATDYKGKGGVSIAITFPGSVARPATRVDFLCVHLDSESAKSRLAGITYMLSKVRTYQGKLSKQLRGEVLTDTGGVGQPCSLFDRDLETCTLPTLDGLQEPPDAVVVLGDLNYRLEQGELNLTDGSLERRIFSPAGRRKLAANDPLAPESEYADALVKPVEDNAGFGFQCNQPHAEYLPTYKRYAGEECALLGQKLTNCSASGNYCKMDDIMNLTRTCYMKTNKKDGNLTWATKKDDVQLGWLDRFCFRTTSSKPRLTLSLMDSEGWMDYPGAKDTENGSDHMPVAATLQLGYATCGCPKVEPGVTVEQCDKAGVPTFRTGELTFVRCGEGEALVDAKGQIHEFVTLKCQEDGTILPVDAIPDVEKLRCQKVCRDFEFNEFVQNPEYLDLGLPVVDGAAVRPSCRDGFMLVGSPDLQCRGGTLVNANAKEPFPSCIRSCPTQIPDKLWIAAQRPASEELLGGDYGEEIWKRFGRNRQLVLDGGEQTFECQRSCLVLGKSTAWCIDSKMQPTPSSMQCACGLDLSVEAADFENAELRSIVDKMKLQFYKGPTTSEKLEELRQGRHSYVAAVKFKPKDMKKHAPEVVSLDRKDDLADLEAHLTLCSPKASKRRHFFSSCSVLAETNSGHGQGLKMLLRQASGTEGVLTMDFPLTYQNLTTTVTLKVRYEAKEEN